MILGSVVASFVQRQNSLVGDPAPGFASRIVAGEGAEEGRSFTLQEARGRVVLVDFWATWCPPCRASIPILSRLHTRFREEGLVVIGVDTEARLPVDELSRAHRRLGGVFPSVQDTTGELMAAYGVSSLPTLFLVDREGTVRYVHIGAADEAVLEREIRRLIR